MRRHFPLLVLAVGLVTAVAAGAGGDKPPMFVRWLQDYDPGDQVIRVYWERAQRGELGAEEMVDLGTMLFYRGYPKDAVRYYRGALDLEPELYEAWFRIGLVEHREGNLRDAEEAYRRCLKLLTGHGWCNFYLGLLKEQTGHPAEALDYYRRAFKFAPELADPKVNPELLYSRLQLGARIGAGARERFADSAPMPYLAPDRVQEVRSQFEPEPPPTVAGASVPASAGAAATAGAAAATGAPAPAEGAAAPVTAEPEGTSHKPERRPSPRVERGARPTPVKPQGEPVLPPRVTTASPEASLGAAWSPWGGGG